VKFYWSAILDVPGLSDGDRLTYVALAACRNEKTGRCNPGLVTLAKRRGVDKATISRQLTNLQRVGAIEMLRGPARGRATEYRLLCWASSSTPPKSPRDHSLGCMGSTSSVAPAQPIDDPLSCTGAANGLHLTREWVAPVRSLHAKEHAKGTPSPLPPALSNGPAGVVVAGEGGVEWILAAVSERRPRPLSPRQKRAALAIAEDLLEAFWAPEEIVEAMVGARAITAAAVEFAASTPPPRRSVSDETISRFLRDET
jgi:hypothetical protein